MKLSDMLIYAGMVAQFFVYTYLGVEIAYIFLIALLLLWSFLTAVVGKWCSRPSISTIRSS